MCVRFAVVYSLHICMKLITTLYNETHLQRRKEYEACILENSRNPHIEEIHVFYDGQDGGGADPLRIFLGRQSKVTVVPCGGRPSYAQCFAYANKHFPEETVLLANGDIAFTETIALGLPLLHQDVFFAFTRQDWVRTSHEGSSDAWMFKTPMREIGENVRIGTCFCDQRIAFLAAKNGLRVFNPCRFISCIHHHVSEVRNRPGISGHSCEGSTTADIFEGVALGDFINHIVERSGMRLNAPLLFSGGLVPPCILLKKNGRPIVRSLRFSFATHYLLRQCAAIFRNCFVQIRDMLLRRLIIPTWNVCLRLRARICRSMMFL